MGGGGLRILPHKKWHVWRRDNIERVLRDEREQEEQQQQQDEKQRRLDQERRAQQLTKDAPSLQEHVKLFQIEKIQAKNSKKKTDQADTLKRYGHLPWYAKGSEAKQPTARQERRRKRELEEKDPLRHMRPKERKDERDEKTYGDSDRRKYSARYDRSTERDRGEDWEQPKKRKRHKEKSTGNHKSRKEASMQELRREREEREAAERQRAERLMHGQ